MVSVYYQNVRGLKTKLTTLYNDISTSDYDIICFTETWLNHTISDTEICDPRRYSVYRRDRDVPGKKQGGGVLVLVSNKICSEDHPEWCSSAEDIWISISNVNHQKVFLCCVYLPPLSDKSVYFDHFNIIKNVSLQHSSNNIIIVGDYNLPAIKWMPTQGKDLLPFSVNRADTYLELTNTISLCNMSQYNHVSNHQGTLLDLILCTFDLNVSNCNDPLTKLDVYHPALEVHFSLFVFKPLSHKQSVSYNFKQCNYEGLIWKLSAINWKDKFKVGSINDNVALFYSILYNLLDTFCPPYKHIQGKYPKWFSRSLIKMIKEKNKFHKKWKTYRDLNDYASFALLRKRIKHVVASDYKNYINYIESNIHSNVNLFWNHTKFIKNDNSVPNSMFYDGTEAHSGNDVSNLFSIFFKSVYIDSVNAVNFDTSDIQDNHINIGSIHLYEDEIFNCLKNMDVKKGCGPDKVHPLFIRSCAYYLSYPLYLIYNKSLSIGVFPDLWKLSYITPVHKSGDKRNITNYRPISILPVFGKIFESLITNKLKSDFINTIIPQQAGFCSKKSVLNNLIPVTEFISKHMDNRTQVDVVYTDFSKAFDRVNHFTLIAKLSAYGIHGSLLRWMESYVMNRSQLVLCNGFKSKIFEVTSGVPQGSHLGPFLFNIYINNISKCFKICDFMLFADDLKLYKSIQSSDDCISMQEDLSRLCEYCCLNDLALNIDKCFIISFTRKRNNINHPYKLHGSNIIRKTSIRDLGVIFDSRLLFNEHVDSIVNKAYKMLGFIYRMSKSYDRVESLLLLYNAFVLPITEYASQIWSPIYRKTIIHIESIQRKFISLLKYKFKMQNVAHDILINDLNLLSLERRRTNADVMFLYKILNNYTDSYRIIESCNFHISPVTTRNTKLFRICKFNSNTLKNSPLNRMMSYYNNEFQHYDLFSLSIVQFKRALLTHL